MAKLKGLRWGWKSVLKGKSDKVKKRRIEGIKGYWRRGEGK
jgi:hypothetical protein